MTAHVYFAQSARTGLVKIGFSSSVDERMKAVEVSDGGPVKLIRVIPFQYSFEARDAETRMHRKFAAHRQDGEWFSISIVDVESAQDDPSEDEGRTQVSIVLPCRLIDQVHELAISRGARIQETYRRLLELGLSEAT